MNASSLKLFHINPETLDFQLPESLIAQEPVAERDQARLLVVHRSSGELEHRIFTDLHHYLKPGDVLVLNKARVNKAKLIGKKPTGGRVEVILLGPSSQNGWWRALVRPMLKEGTKILFQNGVSATLEARDTKGENLLSFEGASADELMNQNGEIPLPPYIKRGELDGRKQKDLVDYQTVYASVPGSVAAPTAGLHFSTELLDRLRKKGIIPVEILLHVGWGTFKPISTNVASHEMLPERFEVSPEAFSEIKKAKQEGRRIISVGTTSTRVLESLPLSASGNQLNGDTNLFIRPGFEFKWVSALVTNLHVPRSTPVSLTAAFAGLPNLEKAYGEAIQRNYRFFSYGDAMLVIE